MEQCDMRRGDTQCPWVLPRWPEPDEGHLNCALVEGHGGHHLTYVEANCPGTRPMGSLPQTEWRKGLPVAGPCKEGR